MQAGAPQVRFGALPQQLADEQPLGRGGRHVAQYFRQAGLQGLGHLEQHQDGGVAGAVLQIGQVPLGHIRRQRQGLARHSPARPQVAHALTQGQQKSVTRRGATRILRRCPCLLLRFAHALPPG
jgi:hypothetical protein